MPRRGLTVCTKGGCPVLVQGGRCPEHRAQVDRARGSRHERGYGSEHDHVRVYLLSVHVEGTPCRVCGAPMLKTQGLDAAHSVPLRIDPHARADHLEHAPCNRAWRKAQA